MTAMHYDDLIQMYYDVQCNNEIMSKRK